MIALAWAKVCSQAGVFFVTSMTCQPNCVLTGAEISPTLRLKAAFVEGLHHAAPGERAEAAAVVLGARVDGVLLGDLGPVASVLLAWSSVWTLSASALVFTRTCRALTRLGRLELCLFAGSL